MQTTFRFHGGALDGQVIAGDSTDRSSLAWRYAFLTDGGRVGKRFLEMPVERTEARRRLFMSDDAYEKWRAAMRAAFSSIDWSNPRPDAEMCDELRAAFEEHGVTSIRQACQFPQEELADRVAQFAEPTEQIYEVRARGEHAHGIEVDVDYIGEDT